MALSAADFRAQLLGADEAGLKHLIRTEILGRAPFCYAEDLGAYEQLRAHLAERLYTEPARIYLVGSGGAGYSIAPDNFPRPFHDRSDLDFAIVSPKLFDASWMPLLSWGHFHKPAFPEADEKWFVARQREIFWGFFTSQSPRFTGINRPELVNNVRLIRLRVFETFQALGKKFPGTEVAARQSNARLYRSEEHLVQYHLDGLHRLKNGLIERNG